MKIKFLSIAAALAILLAGCSTDNGVVTEEPIENDEETIEESTEEEREDEPILATDFSLANLDGKEVFLSDYRGKIVLLNFWTTTCQYCVLEMPDLQKIDRENEDVVLLAANVMEDKAVVEDYIEENGFDFEVLFDEDGEVARQYYISGFPTTYFIDSEGFIIGYYPGYMSYEQTNDILDQIRDI